MKRRRFFGALAALFAAPVAGARYGAPIPYLQGAPRVYGRVIWASPPPFGLQSFVRIGGVGGFLDPNDKERG